VSPVWLSVLVVGAATIAFDADVEGEDRRAVEQGGEEARDRAAESAGLEEREPVVAADCEGVRVPADVVQDVPVESKTPFGSPVEPEVKKT
jgi:hypothetical protein